MPRTNRLAAIMFTDIQGYTRIMQENENQAIDIRSRHRAVFDSATIKNRGEILQYYGDGTLSIFDSCVDAVRCAKQMQKQFQSDPIIPVRIGIHLGDITMTSDDIIGNSVNIASRVESLGIPGNILISEKVYDEIKNKAEFKTHLLGSFHFKNDTHPRKIYAVAGQNIVIPKKHQLKGKLESKKWINRRRNIYAALVMGLLFAYIAFQYVKNYQVTEPRINSLAVLPLNDRIGLQSDEDYILDGLQEEIIVNLTKVGLNVKPYSSMLPYNSNPSTPVKVGKELDVDGLVEGSVFRTENRYKIRVQVIDADQQEYISDPYESEAEMEDIMTLYSDLVESIANQIKHTLSPQAQAYLRENPKVDPIAYDHYLRGRYYYDEKGTSEDLEKAIEFYDKALDIDPNFGQAHLALVECYLLLGFSSSNTFNELEKFRYHMQMAIKRNPYIAHDHHLMAMVKIFDDWDWKAAKQELEKAMSEHPESWETYDSYCQLMWAMGNMESSIKAGEKAISLAPNAHYAHCDLAWAYYLGEEYSQAEELVDETIDNYGDDCPHHNGLQILLEIRQKLNSNHSLIPTIAKMEKEIVRDEGNPVYNLSMLGYAYALEGDISKAKSILKDMDEKNIAGAVKIYIALGEHEKALDLLEREVDNRSSFVIYTLKKAPWYEPIRNYSKYDSILAKMGLKDTQLQ